MLLRLLILLGALASCPLVAFARFSGNGCTAGGRNGPCQFLDSVNVFLPPDRAPVLVSNFGLLRWQANQLGYVCEEVMGGLAVGARMAPDGTIFVPGAQGLFRSGAGCGPTAAAGAVAERTIIDVAFAARERTRAWALVLSPRMILASVDGGATFSAGFTFARDENVLRLGAAPSRPERLYAVGESPAGGPLLVMASDDGGASFVARPRGAGWPAGLPIELLGIDPVDADVLFVAIRNQQGAEEVWRSGDAGATFARVLTLVGTEIVGGFTFGATGRQLYVGARELLPLPDAAPARLFRSEDGGTTWGPPVPSSARGPRFRCLAWAAGTLYACGAGEPGGDDFLLGSSSDDGASFQPSMRVAELAGAEDCAGDACGTTDTWLCARYGICPGVPDGGPPRIDAGGPGPGRGGGEGCGCRVGQGGPAGGGLLLAVAALALVCRRGARR